ncbi:type IV secretion system DNA-binding domain-containing protein [Terriglobus roseus]|uniref:Type IV secretory pathway, VirD4 component, TraG/TraD family ATPase n=1 Tax=Terriglobus roseus TaxID=392734 RepID=A0A1H4W7K8_9BACT|nr:type IV secretion system DNA-binding domain-containing protein [Terriglobus roseus]SEC89352.1 Type IV secretory pathway, VirD4 component, TraG/TraD family ATPase [Terriglobus roseus]
MNSKQAWGRKETIVWPPHAPIYTFSAFALGVMATLFFVWQFLNVEETPLRRTYTTTYAQTLIGATFKQHGKYRLLYVGGGKANPRLALPADFVPGATKLPDGSISPVDLSAAAKQRGYTVFYKGPEKDYNDVALSRWLGDVFFEGKGLVQVYTEPLCEGLLVLVIALGFAGRADVKRFRQLKYGRRLKGPVMVPPPQFNKALKSDGLAFTTAEKPWYARHATQLRIPKRAEPQHIQIMGDTGSGKSTLLTQILQQIADRDEIAIVYDTAGEFTERFYKKDRGDWILNPLDARTPYWTPSSELRNPAEARTIATSMYQPRDDKRGEFFTETPQKIFAHLLKYRPSPEELVDWMSNEEEIDRRLKGTELANFAPMDAPQQRRGVLGSLGLIADGLRLLPTLEEAGGRQWSATEWAEKREGWIFLTSTKATREALRPLQSLWIDLLVLRLLTKPKPNQKKVWLVIDELASLQLLPQFHTALTEGRKSDNPIVFAYQGKAQLETVYGHLAEVMLSMPSTKFIVRTGEPNAAKWAADLIGEVEIERVRETVADGKRQGKSFTLDRQIEPLVMKSEIEGLPDLHTFVKHNNYVSRFAFPHMTLPIIADALLPRAIPESKMWFDPLAPADKKPQPSAPDTTSTKADADEEEEWLTNPEEKPKPKRNAKPKTSAGAPLKEAEALVPQLVPEAPKTVVSTLQVESAPLSHNL